MRTQQTTASNYFSQMHAVSQLAKTTNYAPKTAHSKRFESKTTTLKNPCALTHAQGELELHKLQRSKQKVYDLKPKQQLDFLKFVPLIFTNKPVKVVYHNNDYVNQIFASYNQKLANLFLNWVEAFCIIRRESRLELAPNIYQTHEDDFADALTLFREQDLQHQQTKLLSKEDVLWNIIQTHFACKVFNRKEFKAYSELSPAKIETCLRKLLLQGKLQVNKIVYGVRQYEIN